MGTAHKALSGSLVFSSTVPAALVDDEDAVAVACQGKAGLSLEVDAAGRQAALFQDILHGMRSSVRHCAGKLPDVEKEPASVTGIILQNCGHGAKGLLVRLLLKADVQIPAIAVE